MAGQCKSGKPKIVCTINAEKLQRTLICCSAEEISSVVYLFVDNTVPNGLASNSYAEYIYIYIYYILSYIYIYLIIYIYIYMNTLDVNVDYAYHKT